MYGYNNHHMENTSSNYMYNHLPLTSSQRLVSLPPPHLAIPSVNTEFDSLSPLKSEFGYNSSSSCSSYGSPASSVTSYNDPTSLIQRSISSHTLVKNMEGFCPLASSPTGFLDSETSSVRKVLSTGDLQVMHLLMQHNYRSESTLSSESNSIIEGMNKACRYSPKRRKSELKDTEASEIKEILTRRLRKTLADSRPRIRGRFARNNEIERTSQNEYWNQSRLEEGEEDDQNWTGFLDAFIP